MKQKRWILQRGERNSFVKFGRRSKCGELSCLSFGENLFSLSETRAEVMSNISAERLEENLHLFGHDACFDIYYTFFDFNPCSYESNWVDDCIVQLARLDDFIATVVPAWQNENGEKGFEKRCLRTNSLLRYLRPSESFYKVFTRFWKRDKQTNYIWHEHSTLVNVGCKEDEHLWSKKDGATITAYSFLVLLAIHEK